MFVGGGCSGRKKGHQQLPTAYGNSGDDAAAPPAPPALKPATLVYVTDGLFGETLSPLAVGDRAPVVRAMMRRKVYFWPLPPHPDGRKGPSAVLLLLGTPPTPFHSLPSLLIQEEWAIRCCAPVVPCLSLVQS